jgi:hypothetical protein
MNIFCNIFGHKWRYNFTVIPNKRICKRCKEKQKLNLHTLEWDGTFTDKRSDDVLIKNWFR